MAISISDSDLDDDNDFAETHEINVTPFIDVILVLLIIFMVAAPLSTVDLPVDLPSSTATPQKKPDKPTYVSIKPDLAVAIGETPVKRVDLVRSLDAMADASKDRFIFLRADRAVPYGEMMDVLEILRAGGYAKIKLVALEGVSNPQHRRRKTRSLGLRILRQEALDLNRDARPRHRTKIFPAAVDVRRSRRGRAASSAARRWRWRICRQSDPDDTSAHQRSRSGSK